MRSHFASVALVAFVAMPAFAADPMPAAAPAGATAPAASAPTPAMQKLTFTNKLVDGKKTWSPSTAKIPAGAKVEITLINTLADPHGFTAPGLTNEPVVVPGNDTKTVTVEAKSKGEFKYSCQLHPAHVGGTITVD